MINADKLAEMVEEEAADAMKYAKCAMACREDCPDMAQMFMELSDEEMQHMKQLHEKLKSMYKG